MTDEVFTGHEFFDARDVVQVKYEMVRRARVAGTPVTAAAAAFGYSRQSFYEAAAALDTVADREVLILTATTVE